MGSWQREMSQNVPFLLSGLDSPLRHFPSSFQKYRGLTRLESTNDGFGFPRVGPPPQNLDYHYHLISYTY